MKIRTQTDRQMREPRMVESCASESGDTSRGSDTCLFNAVKVLGEEDNRGVLSNCSFAAVMLNLCLYLMSRVF